MYPSFVHAFQSACQAAARAGTLGLGGLALAMMIPASPALAGKTLDAIKQRGVLHCGVSAGNITGFSLVDAKGSWSGLDVDLCRALVEFPGEIGDARRIYANPLHPYTRALLDSVPKLVLADDEIVSFKPIHGELPSAHRHDG